MQRYRRHHLRGLASSLLLLALTALTGSAAAAERPWTVGIVPQFPPEQIFAAWQPVIEALEARVGGEFELRSFQSIPDFEAAFSRGELDIAYMNTIVCCH